MSQQPAFIDNLQKLDFPMRLTARDLQTAATDASILATRLTEQAPEVLSLLSELLDGASVPKQRLADLKLAEENFVAEGGGMVWLIVVLVLLYSTNAY